MENDEKKCPFCAEAIKAEAIKCKHCGSMLSANPSARVPAKGRMGPLGWAVIVVLVGGSAFLGYGAYLGTTPEGKARNRLNTEIGECHKDLERWSQGSQEWQIMYDVCEGLERDLRAGNLMKYMSGPSSEPKLKEYPAAKGNRMDLQVGQQSAPLKSAVPLRDAPDLTAAVAREAKRGERLTVREVKDGWIQVSADPARKEWAMPELLDW